jgi:hypothetical protein
MKEEPNQSPEPTLPSVMPRAAARVTPAGSVAHLERWAKKDETRDSDSFTLWDSRCANRQGAGDDAKCADKPVDRSKDRSLHFALNKTGVVVDGGHNFLPNVIGEPHGRLARSVALHGL